MTRTFRAAGLKLFALSTLFFAVILAGTVRSQDNKPSPIEGAWKLVEAKSAGAPDYRKLPDGVQMTKLVTGGRFVWTVVSKGRVVAAAGGKYTVDKGKYTESVEYVHGEGQVSLVGKSFDFTWKIDGDSWHHTGTLKLNDQEVKIDEKWQRCK